MALNGRRSLEKAASMSPYCSIGHARRTNASGTAAATYVAGRIHARRAVRPFHALA